MKTMIAIPCMDMMHTAFVRSLTGLRHRGDVEFAFSQGSLVYDGRNKLTKAAIDGGYDRILWLDSDVTFDPDLEEKLHTDLDAGAEMVSALYFTRVEPIKPTVYKLLGMDRDPVGKRYPRAESYLDYPRDRVFPVEGCGFGAVMMTVDLLRRTAEQFGLPFSPMNGFGEDFSFCLRVKQLGVPILCDSRVKLGHVGMFTYDETLYQQRELRVVDL